MWIRSRQYTGRVVTVTNATIFDEPVYNYTRDFPYLWEELTVPLKYGGDHQRAERILLEAAGRRTVSITEMSGEALREMQRRYLMQPADMRPRVYYRLTDNWLELTVRFIARDHEIRELKDALTRDVLAAFSDAGIDIASTTLEIAALPTVRIEGAKLAWPE